LPEKINKFEKKGLDSNINSNFITTRKKENEVEIYEEEESIVNDKSIQKNL
jgi:hypothetical protein